MEWTNEMKRTFTEEQIIGVLKEVVQFSRGRAEEAQADAELRLLSVFARYCGTTTLLLRRASCRRSSIWRRLRCALNLKVAAAHWESICGSQSPEDGRERAFAVNTRCQGASDSERFGRMRPLVGGQHPVADQRRERPVRGFARRSRQGVRGGKLRRVPCPGDRDRAAKIIG
jgi:hypothetical protein